MYERTDAPTNTSEVRAYGESDVSQAASRTAETGTLSSWHPRDEYASEIMESFSHHQPLVVANAQNEDSFFQESLSQSFTAPSSHTGEAGTTNGHAEDKPDRLSFFIGALNPETTKEEILNYLSAFVAVEDVDIKMDVSTGRNRGYAFISVNRAANLDVEAFLSAKHVIREKLVDVRELGKKPSLEQPQHERPPERRMSSTNANRHKIFVGGITSSITDEVLYNHFEQFGPIEKANVIRDGTGKSRGFGFVQFQSIESVSAAVEASPHHLDAENKVDAQPAQDRATRRPPGRYPPVSPYGGGYEASQGYCYSTAQGYGYGAGPYGYHAAAYSPMFSSPYGAYAQAGGYPAQYATAYGSQAYSGEGYGTAGDLSYGAVRRGDSASYGYPSGTARSSRGAPY